MFGKIGNQILIYSPLNLLGVAMNRIVIPHFEPEVMATMTKNGRLDHEKIATTSLKKLLRHGAEITSRYGKAHEFEAMAAMVDGVDQSLRRFISALNCDSKADCYSVSLRPCGTTQANMIANQIDSACYKFDISHNGIFVEGSRGGSIEIGPYYAFDGEV